MNKKSIKYGLLFLLLLTVLPGYATIYYPVNGWQNCQFQAMDAGSADDLCIASYIENYPYILNGNFIFPADRRIFASGVFQGGTWEHIWLVTNDLTGNDVGGATYTVKICNADYTWNILTGKCDEDGYRLNPNSRNDTECRANPCNVITGDKIQYETDYSSPTLKFVRIYNSGNTQYQDNIGKGWGHSFSRHFNTLSATGNNTSSVPLKNTIANTIPGASGIYTTPEAACFDGWNEIKDSVWGGSLADATAVYIGGDLCEIQRAGEAIALFTISSNSASGIPSFPTFTTRHTLHLPNEQMHYFEGSGSAQFDTGISLDIQGDIREYTNRQNDKEVYDQNGFLQSISNRLGQSTVLDYNLSVANGGDDDPETLDKVTDHTDRTLAFSYYPSDFFITGEKRIKELTTPDGVITYDYSSDGNLTKVTYMDGSSKTYHYSNTSVPYHLTGISNENGHRYATWTYYNTHGKVRSSQHSGGAERFEFIYNADSTTVHSALGQKEVITFETIFGAQRTKTISMNYYDGKQAVTKTKTYTYYPENGQVKEATDYNGNITSYEYNARGLVTLKTQAKGTPEAYTVTTTWHPDYRLPASRTYPDRTETYSYNSKGQLISTQTTSVQ